MKESIANQVSEILLSVTATMNESVQIVMDNCELDEFKAYRMIVGQILGTILVDILNPLYADFPNLCPAELYPRPTKRPVGSWLAPASDQSDTKE